MSGLKANVTGSGGSHRCVVVAYSAAFFRFQEGGGCKCQSIYVPSYMAAASRGGAACCPSMCTGTSARARAKQREKREKLFYFSVETD